VIDLSFPSWRHLLVSEVIADMPHDEPINVRCAWARAEGAIVRAQAVADLYQRPVNVWASRPGRPDELYGGCVPTAFAVPGHPL